MATFGLQNSAAFHTRSSMRLFSSSAAALTNSGNNRLFPEEINIIYDSKCNVCDMEIKFLARRDAEVINIGQPKLKMTDLESEDYNPLDPANGGISYKEGMSAIHAVTADGKVVKGVPVFALAYEKVKLGWLFKVTTWPIVKQIVDIGYQLFAKYRTILTRGATIEALVRDYEMKKALEKKMDEEDCQTCKTNESI